MTDSSDNLPDIIKPVHPAKLGLSPRQDKFAEMYALYGIGVKAAIASNYSEKTARAQGSKLLTKSNILSAVEWYKAKLQRKLKVSQERVLREVARISFADPADLFDLETGELLPIPDMPVNIRRVIAGFDTATTYKGKGEDAYPETTKKVKMADKLAALGKLAKHLGLFPDRHELTGKDGKDLFTRQVTPEESQLLMAALSRIGAEVVPGLLPAPKDTVMDAEVEELPSGAKPRKKQGQRKAKKSKA
jgi:phage terminase small subunit